MCQGKEHTSVFTWQLLVKRRMRKWRRRRGRRWMSEEEKEDEWGE